MRRGRHLFALATLTLTVFAVAACAPSETADPAADAVSADLTWLQENKPILDAKREELARLRARLAGEEPEEGTTEEGTTEELVNEETGEPLTPEEIATRLEDHAAALDEETTMLSQQVGEKVVSYLNASAISVGAELTPDQRFVVDVRVDEDIFIAQEFIDKGGDYSRAIDIYNVTLGLDPDNEKIMAAMQRAEELRYMDEERFAQVNKGMTQDEVRALLGQVKHTNVRDFPERNVVGWFYRKDDGGAAGVFFKERRKGQGDWLVYSLDFNSAERGEVGGGEGG